MAGLPLRIWYQDGGSRGWIYTAGLDAEIPFTLNFGYTLKEADNEIQLPACCLQCSEKVK